MNDSAAVLLIDDDPGFTTQTIPVLVCSALRDEERIWEEGADFCLAKPVMYADFLAILASVGLPT
jgi:CheY-like chemotaxis protein